MKDTPSPGETYTYRLATTGEVSAGGPVDLGHTAPTPLAWEERAAATLVETEGMPWEFQVECCDEREKIGQASHTRFVVRAGPFLEAVAKKAARRSPAA